ncbi:hypothetical protein SAMN04490248_103114 [Salinihabitans flavidus]|uniref:DUF6456 domain-containing protein n=1 Tax=Salinihabitans flavidus TaxID=569882 RepID=A0A1H8NCQ8_9RHOB|nr:DUF6456 domain-containing protein [Salinihabitans flavidus]SEO27367.1 hypothetical protein SAMN04490248_103114 [Salinihabitans flavidus]
MTQKIVTENEMPGWVPAGARRYLEHTEKGLSIRELARDAQCHASTVMRQIRRMEARRDDPLVDAALCALGDRQVKQKGMSAMAEKTEPECDAPDETTLRREARRVLRRLCETGAVLAVASEMEKAVVVRDGADGATMRTAVVARSVAQAMALKNWIACDAPGRVSRYAITTTGRNALGEMMAEAENRAQGFAEAQAAFATRPAARDRTGREETAARPRRMRFAMTESPLSALARRRGKDGAPFLSDDLVAAGERLREDFELANMGVRVTQNWEHFLTAGSRGGGSFGDGHGTGPEAARRRVTGALEYLGEGLADVALRCCCYLEGLETAERRLGWSARSGKIVLRIALIRLREHYAALGSKGQMIG